MNIVFFILEFFSAFLLLVLTPIYFIFRKLSGKSTEGYLAKAGFFNPGKPLNEKIIMFHGVSVGEVIALENLIKLTYETFKDYKIIITTGTKTGQDIANKKYSDIAEYITFFPFDMPYCVKRFFNKIRPDIILMAETELWPSFAMYARKKNIPLLLINGRISDDSFKAYKYFGWFFKHIFACYTGIFTQSEDDRQKMIKMGARADKTEVMKNLKFDIQKNPNPINFNKAEERILLAGSTHKGEDEIVLKIFKNLKNKFPDLKLIIAPRHLTRKQDVETLIKEIGFKHALRSDTNAGAAFGENDIILLDTLGELSRMYKIADIAFIGGSFNNTGGHNPLEAVIYSKPVISGPSIKNFKDIYSLLTKSGAASVVKNQAEFEQYTEKLLSDKDFYNKTVQNAAKIFESQKGAKDFVIDKIRETL